MKRMTWLLLIMMITPSTTLMYHVCVDRTIEYNSDLMPSLNIPKAMPNCSPGRNTYMDSGIPPQIWLVSCNHACLTLEWRRGNQVTDRLRHCSTGILKKQENSTSNMTIPVVLLSRFPGMEAHILLCNETLCNDSRDLEYKRKDAQMMDTTTEPPSSTTLITSTQSPVTTSHEAERLKKFRRISHKSKSTRIYKDVFVAAVMILHFY